MSQEPNSAARGLLRGFRQDLRVLEREIVRQLEDETGCCGVTLTQCHVLLELSASELSLSGLAALLNLDSSTLSRTVETMVQAGWVERTVNRADRRGVRLTLARAGRDKAATINRKCDRYYSALLGLLDEKDQRQIARAVRLLADGMRRARAGRPEKVCRCRAERKESSDGK
jgi:DNA-binding MarR family transcriptional regulator